MSKAFTRETEAQDDFEEDEPKEDNTSSGKNYITPNGALRLQQELYQLKHKLRPEITEVVTWAASNGDRSENADYQYGKRKLREIDRRIRFLTKRLDIAEVVDPTKQTSDQIFFGATVTIRDEDDSTRTYSIVGTDEIDIEKGRISWVSPLANALLKARAGDFVSFRSPRGLRELEILEVKYVELP